jgi:hypothetical protein
MYRFKKNLPCFNQEYFGEWWLFLLYYETMTLAQRINDEVHKFCLTFAALELLQTGETLSLSTLLTLFIIIRLSSRRTVGR